MRSILIASAILLAGCTISSPADELAENPLAAGNFVKMYWDGGFVPAGSVGEHVWVTPFGELFTLHGSSKAGTGKVSFDGEHPGLSSAQAKSLLKDAGFDTKGRDYDLSGFGGAVTEDELMSLLQAAQWFDQTPAEHNQHPNLADAGWLNIEVTSNQGEGTPNTVKKSKAYAGDGDSDFEKMEEAITVLIERVASSQGVDY